MQFYIYPGDRLRTTFQDMPFSGLVQENGTWVGKGYAFYLLKLLSSKLNFTYTIVPPKQHVLGNKQKGILNLLYEKVSPTFLSPINSRFLHNDKSKKIKKNVNIFCYLNRKSIWQ